MDADTARDLHIYYSPFEYVTPSPRLILLGITPGRDQASQANHALWREIRKGSPETEALREAKLAGAFLGEPIRSNLLRQLADWRVHEWLGLSSAEEVLTTGQEQGLVQLTSSLRFPTFKGTKEYSGASPEILGNTLLRSYFVTHLSTETAQWGDALIIPLGKKPLAIVDALCNRGQIRRENVCAGMLHPSRNDLARLNWLLSDRTGRRPDKTDPDAYDEGRANFQNKHLAL